MTEKVDAAKSSENTSKWKIHKSWYPILAIIFIMSFGGAYGGYLFAESNTKEWESHYMGSQ